MNQHRSGIRALAYVAVAGALAALTPMSSGQTALGTGFSFQGELSIAGQPANGPADLRFRLFDRLAGGLQVGPTVTQAAVATNQGIFSTTIDFGAGAFKGDQRWLEIAVREPGTTTFTVLTPRRAVTATPNALFAECAASAQNVFSVNGADATVAFNNAECSIGVTPNLPGLNLRDPSCIRVINPTGGPNKIAFGPTNNCNIGTDPDFTGIVERDPTGFRLLGVQEQGCRLLFGPTDLCTVEVQPTGPSGLQLRDPTCIRVINPTGGPNKIVFGPTDDCNIGTIPNLPGLAESDPFGFRILGRNFEGCRLLFGPTDDCTIEVPVDGPRGLRLRDPRGIRVVSPDPELPPVLRFGMNDGCFIAGPTELDPFGPLKLCDPNGFDFQGRGLGVNLRPGQTAKFAVQVGGAVAAEEFIQFSSGRFKEDVATIDDALGLVERLRGVSFDWIEMNDGKHDIGFIAEEVAAVLPELVQMQDGEAVGVAYHRLTAVTVEAIKAQQREIEALTTERAEMEARIARLEALVQALATSGGE